METPRTIVSSEVGVANGQGVTELKAPPGAVADEDFVSWAAFSEVADMFFDDMIYQYISWMDFTKASLICRTPGSPRRRSHGHSRTMNWIISQSMVLVRSCIYILVIHVIYKCL